MATTLAHNVPPVGASTQTALPLWSAPDCRSDRRWTLARLYREIVLRDDPTDGCYAKNATLAKEIGCDPATIRGYVAELKELGLVTVEILHGRERHIYPQAPLVELFEIWPELARACATTKRVAASIRAFAAEVLRGAARSIRRCATGAPRSMCAAPSSARKYAPSTPGSTRVLPDKREHGVEEQQTAQRSAPIAAPQARAAVVASSPTAPSPADPGIVAAIEALGVSQATAIRLSTSAPVEIIRQAGRAVRQRIEAGKVHNPAGMLTEAIRQRWQPTAPRSEAQEARGGVPAPRLVQVAPPPTFEAVTAASLPADMKPEVRRLMLRRAGGVA